MTPEERERDQALGVVGGGLLVSALMVALVWTIAGFGVAVLAFIGTLAASAATLGVGVMLEDRAGSRGL